MRYGDFSVEVVPQGGGRVRETESGHVLARPGQVYRLRLRNHGPLHAVVAIDLDGRCITAGGLVVRPFSATELERPLSGDNGRFTVVAEGDETVFGPDGGRDNERLGLIDAQFRRELPNSMTRREPPPRAAIPVNMPPTRPLPVDPPTIPTRFPPPVLPEWSPPSGLMRMAEPKVVGFERAAGTGLTGHSDQRFEPTSLGPLENEATVLQLRIVIASEAAIAEDTPAPINREAPARPAARP